MRTRRYSFKASGTIQNAEKAAGIMKNNLNKGPESITQHLYGGYFKVPEQDRVDKIEFMTKDGELSSIEISTYEWLQKNKKEQITEAVKMAAAKTGENIHIDSNMKYIATDENLPEYLYHITEKKQLDSIMEKGLNPKRGHNDWKSKKRCTYFAEAEYIVPWLGILGNVEEPVILEVKTEKIPGIEQGRIWNDRGYVPGNIYSEHRTTEIVPPDALRVLSPKEIKNLGVARRAVSQLAHLPDSESTFKESEKFEVTRSLTRLKDMGVITKQEDIELKDVLMEMTENENNTSSTENVPPPWEEKPKTQDASLLGIRRKEQFNALMNMPDRDLCEMIRAHFETHPAMPGEAVLKREMNQALDLADQSDEPQDIKLSDKESVVRAYVNTRIRETKLNGFILPNTLERKHIPGDMRPNVTIDKVNVELQKKGNHVYVAAGPHTIIGELPEKFLKNNPMNVDICKAELRITDYSNGKGKNISSRIVVDTDKMSGDVLELDNEMLTGLDKSLDIKQ